MGTADHVEASPALRLAGVSKRFGATQAVDQVTLEVARNRIVGLVGENGAGKSTIFNILSGITEPDQGHIELHGRPIAPKGYRQAVELGISRVFQEQALIPTISVFENILLSHEREFSTYGVMQRRRMISVAQGIVDTFDLDVDVTNSTSQYGMSIRQVIEIARACLVPQKVLGISYPVVLLDEPTAVLQKTDETILFKVMRQLKKYGTVLFVSHRLSEVLEICDSIYVLKDGCVVKHLDAIDTDENELHSLMVGRERDTDYYHEDEQVDVQNASIVFSTHELTRGGQYEDITLSVRAGEIVGIGGLLNSGKTEFGKGAAGIDTPQTGVVEICGHPVSTPQLAKMTRLGLGYVPAERLVDGMISAFSVATNVSLAGGADMFTRMLGIWDSRLEREITDEYIDELSIKTPSANGSCSSLSGGNQQKVVLARWLCRDLKVLILDNPTRGVDAGAKEEIYGLIRQLTVRGVGVLLITDELLELIGLSNRIAIFRDRRIASFVEAPAEEKPSEREVISLMLGAGEENVEQVINENGRIAR